jgi:quercetin dioxygenase-like cupin family protein
MPATRLPMSEGNIRGTQTPRRALRWRVDNEGEKMSCVRIRRLHTVVAVVALLGVTSVGQSQVGLERKVLLQQDLPIVGYEAVLADVTIAVGGREGRHSHSGTLVGRILQGELTVDTEGQPKKVLKAGDPFLVEAGRVHEGVNTGNVPVKVLATFITEKGKPLTIPAQ